VVDKKPERLQTPSLAILVRFLHRVTLCILCQGLTSNVYSSGGGIGLLLEVQNIKHPGGKIGRNT